MNENINAIKYDNYYDVTPKEGYLMWFNNSKVEMLTVPLDFDFSQLITTQDPDYVPQEPSDTGNELSQLQENQIKLSKLNLSAYLETHPLFSTFKYEEGRYYNVTSEKQQQMTSKMMLNELYKAQGIPYELTWNDTGNICEPCTEVELATLSMQVDAYVTPLIKMQQTIEVEIKNATTQEEVLQIDVTYSDENIQRYVTES